MERLTAPANMASLKDKLTAPAPPPPLDDFAAPKDPSSEPVVVASLLEPDRPARLPTPKDSSFLVLLRFSRRSPPAPLLSGSAASLTFEGRHWRYDGTGAGEAAAAAETAAPAAVTPAAELAADGIRMAVLTIAAALE